LHGSTDDKLSDQAPFFSGKINIVQSQLLLGKLPIFAWQITNLAG
jgi:hypothetical protein